MLNQEIIYKIEIANFAYDEYAKNHQISSEQLQKLITKKRFEDELAFHIEQYNQNDDHINDEFRNSLKQLEVDSQKKIDEPRAIASVSVAEYYQSKLKIVNKEYCHKQLHLIEEYGKKTRQTARKYDYFQSEKLKDFQHQLTEKQEKIQPQLEKLEQVDQIIVVGDHGYSSVILQKKSLNAISNKVTS